jgi:hypothetical protein
MIIFAQLKSKKIDSSLRQYFYQILNKNQNEI